MHAVRNTLCVSTHGLHQHVLLAQNVNTFYSRVMQAIQPPDLRLSDLRQRADLSQTALGVELGVTTSTIWRWEHGRVSIPDTQKVALATRFGVTVGYLMGWEAA